MANRIRNPAGGPNFYKGMPSPNPGGRSKNLSAWRKSPEAQELRDLSYATLKEIVQPQNRAQDRLIAARELLDRIEGRPVQMVGTEDNSPVRVDFDLLAALARLAKPKDQ